MNLKEYYYFNDISTIQTASTCALKTVSQRLSGTGFQIIIKSLTYILKPEVLILNKKPKHIIISCNYIYFTDLVLKII